MRNAAQRIMELFAGYEGQHGTHGTPDLDQNGLKWGIKKTARTIKEPVTPELWKQHLDGKRPLGVVPIMRDSTCWWGSIDIDQYDVDLLEIVKQVEAAKLPLVPCRSKSGGLHLFIFFLTPVAADKVQMALRDIAASLGFAGCEIFPKQTKILVDKGDQGNWMVMPYYGDTFGGKLKFQYGLKKTGAEQTLEEFLTFAERRRINEDTLVGLRAPEGKGKRGKAGNGKAGAEDFSNGPPCLQHMARGGFPEDGRKRAMFMIGIFLKRAHPKEWQQRMEQDNQKHFRPPLPSDEINSIIKSLGKKEYEYTCKEQPMAKHCDSMTCRTRKFGVGVAGAYPEITGLSKLDIDPPIWFVDVPGARISLSTEELQNYRKFHKRCMENNITFKPLSESVWWGIVSEAMQDIKDIEYDGEDLSAGDIFRELLETFLTNRTRGLRKEDLLRGAPWEDEELGRHWFQMNALQKFLVREGVRDMSRGQIAMRIRTDLQGGNEQKMIKGFNRQLWWVPTSVIVPAAEIEPPEIEKGEEV